MTQPDRQIRLTHRLKAGEPLTGEELAQVEAGEFKGAAHVPSKVALAKLFGVDRATIMRWCQLDGAPVPHSNGRHDVAAWAGFIREHKLRPDGTGGTEAEESLNARKLRLQCEKIELDIQIARGQRLPVEEVRETCQAVVQALVQAINQLPMPDGMHSQEKQVRAAIRQSLYESATQHNLLAGVVNSTAAA